MGVLENFIIEVGINSGLMHLFYVLVWFDNAHSITSSMVKTPIRVDELQKRLKGYMFHDYILEGFSRGFRIGVDERSVDMLKLGKIRKSTASVRFADELVDKLNTELKAGRVLGPYDDLPCDNLVISPLYVIEKSTPGKYRLIHHLSSPRGRSVNDCIVDNMKTVQYCSLLDVARYIHDQGLGANIYMAKMDLKDAYRCVPIHKDNWHLLGMSYQDKYFVDTCLPMGLASSCLIFSIISDAINWMATKRCEARIFSYLDDFLVVCSTKESTASSLDTLLELCQDIGFPVSEHKTEYPAKRMVFLGLGIDCDTQSFFVPEEKRLKLIQQIDVFLSARKRLVRDFQKLLGKLNFVSVTLIPGKSLMHSMFVQLRGVLSSEGWKSRRVTKNIAKDLGIWRRFLVDCASKQFKFLFPGSSYQHCVTTDASGSVGYGCVLEDLWFQGRWEDEWWSAKNIALLELYPIFVALRLWAERFQDSVVRVVTDNSSVVSMLQDFYSHDSLVNSMLKECAFVVMSYNIVLQPLHIAGAANVLADRLSRYLPCPQLSAEGKVNVMDSLRPNVIKEMLLK